MWSARAARGNGEAGRGEAGVRALREKGQRGEGKVVAGTAGLPRRSQRQAQGKDAGQARWRLRRLRRSRRWRTCSTSPTLTDADLESSAMAPRLVRLCPISLSGTVRTVPLVLSTCRSRARAQRARAAARNVGGERARAQGKSPLGCPPLRVGAQRSGAEGRGRELQASAHARGRPWRGAREGGGAHLEARVLNLDNDADARGVEAHEVVQREGAERLAARADLGCLGQVGRAYLELWPSRAKRNEAGVPQARMSRKGVRAGAGPKAGGGTESAAVNEGQCHGALRSERTRRAEAGDTLPSTLALSLRALCALCAVAH